MVCRFIFLCWVGLLVVLTGHADLDDFQEPYYLGGIQVNETDHGQWTSALKQQGMNTVSVTVYARQGEWDTDQLAFDVEDSGVLSEIRVAKANGLKVVLIPRVALDSAFPRNNGLWHGMIMPKSEHQLESWFRRYGAFLNQWAKIAEEEKVDVFALGSEMKALTHTVVGDREGIQKEIKDFNAWYESFPDQIAAAGGDPEKVQDCVLIY